MGYFPSGSNSNAMPTMAMEHSMRAYASFAKSLPIGGSPATRRRQKEEAEREKADHERELLVRKAGAMAEFAQVMAEQNERMLSGLRSLQQPAGPPEKVDYIARNKIGRAHV